MDIQAEMKQKAEAARAASRKLAVLSTSVKNAALMAMADVLEKRSELILKANELDLEEARQKKVRRSYLDRLLLDEGRIASMAEACGKRHPCQTLSDRGIIRPYARMALRSAGFASLWASLASFTKRAPM